MRRQQILTDQVLQSLGALVEAITEAIADSGDFAANSAIHFLRNYTTEPVDPYLQYFLLKNDINPDIEHGGYGTVLQEVLDPDSPLLRRQPNVVVLSLLLDLFDPACVNENWSSTDAITQFEDVVTALMEKTRSHIVINTFLPPVAVLAGDESTSRSDHELQILNNHVQELARRHSGRLSLVDWRACFDTGADSQSVDLRFWRSSQAPFKKSFLIEYARAISRAVRKTKLVAKKCLVLDCDNTLWGGVVGEDGLEGIMLHDKEEPGRYYYEFQREVVRLSKSGVIIALCSKNNDGDVWDVIDKHPHCLIDRSQIVASRINWTNKAENLKSLADELNIGLDSIVFVDDSPQEQMLIHQMLPEVTVLSVPEDLQKFSNVLTCDGLFDSMSQTDEDKARTTMYQQETRRKTDMQSYSDLNNYLKSLGTIARIRDVDNEIVARVSQLTQKTNQFNLTTRRYSESEISDFVSSADHRVMSMSVTDKFGDMGLTGVFIVRREGSTAVIDSLLLSCRVLGRQLEVAFVCECMRLVKENWGTTSWRAEFRRTRKNDQVSNFWELLGFDVVSESDESRDYAAPDCSPSVDYSNIITVFLE